jgi:putative flippase GtrA
MNEGKRIMQTIVDFISRLPGGSWLFKQRFAKFGAVGFSGTLVNLAVLYIAQEFLFRDVRNPYLQFNLSLAAAIFIATLHNFVWNRAWTWGDRKSLIQKHVAVQFMQYCAACWLAIALQIFFTNVFKQYMYYMLANILAIVLTAFLNYVINHSWTFKAQKKPLRGSDS